MRALNGRSRVYRLVSLIVFGVSLFSAPLPSVAALTECEKLQRVLEFFGDGSAFNHAVEFASSEKWYKMLQGIDSPWTNHVLMSEKGLYRKIESMKDRVATAGSKTLSKDIDTAATRFLSEDIAKEMLVEGFKRMDILSTGKRADLGDSFTLRRDPSDPSKQLLRISFNVDRPIGMGYVLGKDRFSDPVRVDGLKRVTLVVRKTKNQEDLSKDFYHVLTFYPDAVAPKPR